MPKPSNTQTVINSTQNVSRMPAPPLISEVEAFFSENYYPETEAQKFFYYNNGKAWQLNNNNAITDWHSLAHKWMLNEKSNTIKKQQTIYHTETNKDYSLPL